MIKETKAKHCKCCGSAVEGSEEMYKVRLERKQNYTTRVKAGSMVEASNLAVYEAEKESTFESGMWTAHCISGGPTFEKTD